MPTKLALSIRRRLRFPLYTIGPLLSLIIIFIPLQRYITLARYQHYGIAILAWGLCYVIQTIWSWQKIIFWMRMSYLLTGLYLVSASLFFYANPWLDVNMSVETAKQNGLRHLLGYSYAGLSLGLVFLWHKAYKEEAKELNKNDKQ